MARTQISQGSKGADVQFLQEFLNTKGYKLDVDGDFGPNTKNALMDFQRKYGLDADGIAGNFTWELIGDMTGNTSNYMASNNKGTNTSTAAPNVGKAPTAPTFNTTATAKPNTNTTSWDDTKKGQAALGSYNSAKDKVNNYGDFTYEDYKESEAVKNAGNALNTHLANKPGAYQSQWQSQLDTLMNSIMNRDKFSYDVNGDALYQQAKDKYVQLGKLGMADAIGQASAMTGGYGNSYAQSVGQQAYQNQLDNLNDIIPDLYAMALDQYNREGQELYNQYGMVADRENLDYSRYRDTVADWMTDRGYLTDRYDSERGFDYGKYVDDRNMDYALHQDGYQKLLDALGIAQSDYYSGGDVYRAEQTIKNEDAWNKYQAAEEARQYANSLLQQKYQNDFGAWEANSENAWKQAQWDEAARQYANDQAWKQKEYELALKEYNAKYGSSGGSGSSGSSGGSSGGSSSGGSSGGNKNTFVIPEINIKKMQTALGITADGKWGPESAKASGFDTAEEAWEAYKNGKLVKKEDIPSYNEIEDDLNALIASGATKSEINSALRDSLNRGHITQEQYNKLKNQFAPKGYTY